jgi:hypothetical protein
MLNGQGFAAVGEIVIVQPVQKPNRITSVQFKTKYRLDNVRPGLNLNKVIELRIYSSTPIAQNPLLAVRAFSQVTPHLISNVHQDLL